MPTNVSIWSSSFFLRKKVGELRMVFENRAHKKITIPDSNQPPPIFEALDQDSVANLLANVDLLCAYHQMRIRNEDNSKPATRTKLGSYE